MILDSMGRHAGSDCDCGHDIFCLVPIKIRIMMEGSRGAMLAQCRRQHWVLPILTVNGVHERPAKSKRVVNHNRVSAMGTLKKSCLESYCGHREDARQKPAEDAHYPLGNPVLMTTMRLTRTRKLIGDCPDTTIKSQKGSCNATWRIHQSLIGATARI
ncbi:hypothetical protein AB1N83_007047 [Pleurotus pulmonarius]